MHCKADLGTFQAILDVFRAGFSAFLFALAVRIRLFLRVIARRLLLLVLSGVFTASII